MLLFPWNLVHPALDIVLRHEFSALVSCPWCFDFLVAWCFKRSLGLIHVDVQIGKVGALEEVDEYRVETLCVGRETVGRVVEALKK